MTTYALPPAEAVQGYFSPIPPPPLLAKRLADGLYLVTSVGLEKRCPRCKEYWPADTEFWWKCKRADGLFCWCRACYSENRWPDGRSVQPSRSVSIMESRA